MTTAAKSTTWCRWFADLTNDDVAEVGGKNASLGEMVRELGELGVKVPDGFATTADAYRTFLTANDLDDKIAKEIGRFRDGTRLSTVGKKIRDLILKADLPGPLAEAITSHYGELSQRAGRHDGLDVAVRSSATAEDLPDASFAGQQDTFLNIRGPDALLDAVRRCYASLFNNRAIAYREEKGFDHLEVALSVGIQRMVRSDEASAGVMFTIDTETGFPDAVLIDAAYGLGESVVGGLVDPDEYRVFKPLLHDPDRPGLVPIISKKLGTKSTKIVYAEGGDDPTATVDTDEADQTRFVLDDRAIIELAHAALTIERHYGRPMDIEWAKDGPDGDLFIVQARPETVAASRQTSSIHTYRIHEHPEPLVTGEAIGQSIGSGEVTVIDSPADGDKLPDGGVLVTGMTDPDWVPIMKRAGAIVTDHGGRTSHAAIVSRELGVTAVIGTGDATERLKGAGIVTVSCAEGSTGKVYEGELDYDVVDHDLTDIPDTRTKVMLNLAEPDGALRWWQLPADGVGLARMEFVIGQHVQAHPLALLHPDRIESDDDRARIAELVRGFPDPTTYFVETLARGLASIAASQHPRKVIVRMSDFKTNEYAELVGGRAFEPHEENPMIGWRGASRYYHDDYRDGFALECQAIHLARETIGMDNIVVMIPFCRTLTEADAVLTTLAEHDLIRGAHGLEIYVMAEIPSNALLAEEFAAHFDGFSIGSNDLTQLVLGMDRDSDILGTQFDEYDPAVRKAIEMVIDGGHAKGKPVGLCGQAPSDHPEFAEFLVQSGIDSMSVTPDSFLAVKEHVATAEREYGHEPAPDEHRG
ncbi:MAG: phosphoenolpyruvate synthase [Acidimicrobiales bacterium]